MLQGVSGAELHLVRWPLHPEAPFDVRIPEGIKVYERKAYKAKSLVELIKTVDPDLIYCHSREDKAYRAVCRHFASKIPVVVGITAPWNGSVAQRMAGWFRRWLIRPYFTHAWIPGPAQRAYARHLGFAESRIHEGLYSADVRHFSKIYENYSAQKAAKFPRRFIYAGRYMGYKGLVEMWEAFVELQQETPNEWELWCLGTGSLWDKKTEHPAIRHLGFVAPSEIENYLSQTGVFILPSRYDPWAVVVHEFAASGFPIIATTAVGSAATFVDEGQNGFIVPPAHKASLKTAMRRMMELPDEALSRMAAHSTVKASEVSPEKWTSTLLSILAEGK